MVAATKSPSVPVAFGARRHMWHMLAFHAEFGVSMLTIVKVQQGRAHTLPDL